MTRSFRQFHRWMALLFTLVTGVVYAMAATATPPEWIYYLPLAPLLALFLTGAWLWVRPYILGG